LVSVAVTAEDMSSAELAQLAVSAMGDSNQNAQLSGFDTAYSRQIGYSSDGYVNQTIYYDDIGGGSILQWGESGDMPLNERTFYIPYVGDSLNVTNWNNGKVNQTIYIRNSEDLNLTQRVGGGAEGITVMQRFGGLKAILFPDPKAPEIEPSGQWWFCGKPVNGRSGKPLCAEKIASRMFNGTATARDYYMLQVLEDEDVFPPEKIMPHITMTKWNITRSGDNLTIKFVAHNYGKQVYNATLMLDLIPRVNITGINGNSKTFQSNDVIDFKAPDRTVWFNGTETRSIELGKYTVSGMKEIKEEIAVPLNGIDIKGLEMSLISE
jgi:hypothetical protein